MNTLIQILFFSVGLTFVICDKKADIQCMKKRTKAMEGMTDNQLYDLTQENLNIGTQMVSKRVEIAYKSGLTCYKQFYDKYAKGLSSILQSGEKPRLDKAKTPEERSGAIKGLAGITQTMRCDEDWRAEHFNETIKSAKCTATEEKTSALKLLNFRPKLALLEKGMFLAKYGLKLKNNVMSGIVGEILILYKNVYSEGEKCADSQSTPAEKCRHLKMFVKELDRLFQLFELQILAKILNK